MTSLEITKWQAYENFVGPLDGRWRDDVLAVIDERLQALVHITSAVNSKNGKSPETEPRHTSRPWELATEVNTDGEWIA